MTARLFALLSSAFAALALAACGGDSNADKSVDELLRSTFSNDQSVESGRLNAQLDANVQGVENLQGPVRIRLNGPFQSGGEKEMPRFDFTLGLTAGGQSFTAGGVSTGDKGFVRFQDQTYAVSAELFKRFRDGYLRAARESDSKSNAPSLGALGIDPRRWLRDARKAGEQDVGGAETIKISAGIDIPKLLDDLNRLLGRASEASGGQEQVPSRLTDEQRRQIEQAVQSAEVDVYTGKDDTMLRKLEVRVQLRRSGQLEGGNLRFVLQFDQLNSDQEITEPKNARPLDELIQGLGASGQAQPGTGGGQATTPEQPPGGGAGGEDYARCLQEAGDDVRKLQECAELLNDGG
jgi:hypothetical protein